MQFRIARFAVLLMLLLVAASVALADPVPRSAPPNDNFENAEEIKLGKSYTAVDIDLATDEAGEPFDCGDPYRSVWYKLPVVDQNVLVYFSTGGSILVDSYTEVRVQMALFSGTELNSLTNEACGSTQDTNWNSYLPGWLSPDEIYYLQLSSGFGDWQPGSFIQLTTRVTYAELPPANNGFEDPLTPDDWTVKVAEGDEDDTVLCSNLDYPPVGGLCSFVFFGGEGQSTKLVQNIPAPNHLKLRKGATILAEARFRLDDAAAVENAKLVLKLTYNDGTNATKASISLNRQTPNYHFYSVALPLASSKLKSIKYQLVDKSTGGVLLADNTFVYYLATPDIRDAPALPLPVPAAP